VRWSEWAVGEEMFLIAGVVVEMGCREQIVAWSRHVAGGWCCREQNVSWSGSMAVEVAVEKKCYLERVSGGWMML